MGRIAVHYTYIEKRAYGHREWAGLAVFRGAGEGRDDSLDRELMDRLEKAVKDLGGTFVPGRVGLSPAMPGRAGQGHVLTSMEHAVRLTDRDATEIRPFREFVREVEAVAFEARLLSLAREIREIGRRSAGDDDDGGKLEDKADAADRLADAIFRFYGQDDGPEASSGDAPAACGPK
jgi:hypothetical protein